MRRRDFAILATSLIAAVTTAGAQATDDDGSSASGGLIAALRRFQALPGTKSYVLSVGENGSFGRIAYQPNVVLFVASAFKTFVLGQYLRDVEAGALSEGEQLAVDDNVRSPGSPVFDNLTGTTTARSVLEAMISHSDNTATDIAMAKVGANQVRALITQAGLRSTRIPDSTRIFASYLVGAPPGIDLGWPGILEDSRTPQARCARPSTTFRRWRVPRATSCPGMSRRCKERFSRNQRR